MKKLRYVAAVAAICLALTSCAAPQEVEGTPVPTVETTAEPTVEPTVVPTEEQGETMNLFAELFPKNNNVPSGKEFQKISKELAEGVKGRVAEVTYTWKNGKVSMDVLAGVYDAYSTTQAPQGDVLQLVYDESELYNYVLYLPDGYDPDDRETKWPVIYFFHGIGESGSDLEVLLNYGIPKYLKQGGKLDAIMIAPQCPGNSHWADTNIEEEKLVRFVPEMSEKYNIDTDRMYLTGLSMGGRCTWKLALAMPDTFAAIAVVCGRTNTYEFDTIKDMPVWMFHGAGDGTVSFSNINTIVPLLIENAHRYFKLTVFPSGGHDIWTTVYERPELYDWLLNQSVSANAQSES